VRLNGDAMNPMLVRALVASVPVFLLLVYSVAVLVTRKTISAVLQLVGATCLVVMVLTRPAVHQVRDSTDECLERNERRRHPVRD